MILIRKNEVICPNDQGMLDKFCNLVDDADIWQLAQMVAPEFRSAKEDRWDPSLRVIAKLISDWD